ncbi:MAG: malate synthase A [Myxococcales bacterium]|nr:malate synthase A [Myxococcales bacterium]
MSTNLPPGVELHGPEVAGLHDVLTTEAVAFVAELARRFGPRIEERLAARVVRQRALDAGEQLDFLPETKAVREGDWKVAPLPADLLDRRVEITGPVERKMIINALNSGANVFMADFEDANAPTWSNVIAGQVNLSDAVRRTITFEQNGKKYALGDKPAVLFVRPRGLHLPERHLHVDGRPVPGSLFDFGLFFFRNAKEQLSRGTGPYFYLPKLESHLEAQIWDDVFSFAEDAVGIPRGSIKATVLIETLPAAFEMHEILHALRAHSAGLNCGRWDYIFSFIKKRRADATAVLPDRAEVTMDKSFLAAYAQLVIQTCHRRGVHAMGGMAAQIPIKSDPVKNEAALGKVRADKEREARDGHDGTWVAHPGLVAIAREVFDAKLGSAPNQLGVLRDDVKVGQAELLAVPTGNRTEKGLRHNVRVGVQYLEAWLRGEGCVPLYDLMEDAATAEISRAQVWQWLHFGAPIAWADGTTGPLTRDRLSVIVDEELRGVTGPKLAEARRIFEQLATADTFEDFLTLPAYERIVTLT